MLAYGSGPKQMKHSNNDAKRANSPSASRYLVACLTVFVSVLSESCSSLEVQPAGGSRAVQSQPGHLSPACKTVIRDCRRM